MAHKPPNFAPPSGYPPAEIAPVAALARPQELKNWSAGLVRIIQRNEASIFDDFDFRAGRLTRADLTRTLRKITGCGSVVELRAKVDRNTGEMTPPALHAANFCGQHAICPYCAARVQDRRKARFREPIMAAARQYPHAYLVTATIPPVPTWREDLDLLLSSWKAFRKMGQKRTGRASARSSGEWSKIRGGISKVEIKRGEGSGLPHCHVHALFFTDALIDYRIWSKEEKLKPVRLRAPLFRIPVSAARLAWRPAASRRVPFLPLPWWTAASKVSAEWFAASGGSAMGIDIKKIKWREPKRRKDEGAPAYAERRENWSLADSVYEQAREVLKYATKFDTSPEVESESLFARDFASIKSATYGRRLFQTYGAFRAVGGDDYTGSPCALAQNPVIYEARWRADRYSPLLERTKPVFVNSDPSPGLTRRLQVLNRLQGKTRRIRTAIHAAKTRYLADGYLGPAELVVREYLPDPPAPFKRRGRNRFGFVDRLEYLEVPGYVLATPGDVGAWERWQDEVTEVGRGAYASAREDLDLDSHAAIAGTPEERASQARAMWFARRLMPGYQDGIVRAFLEVLDPPEERAASSPPR